ncbi:CopG family ribbon-helix-helix protein [Bradyrhizobium oligotrophicum]|uniref:CopG family ribbon-helix-helix protein n=1 Tax=Bradyrhizobium oligotrophicum TaxID=44255 RepID=UPI003EBF057E
MPTVPLEFELQTDVESRLQQLADARRQPAETLLREAVEQYVEREEGRARLQQDAVAAWDDYQSTGLHVTGDEADAWLARLVAGEDVEPPSPHG